MKWEKPKVKRKKSLAQWNFEIRPDAITSYEELLKPTNEEKQYRLRQYMLNYEKAKDEFERRSSLTAFDFSILFIAAAMQTVRWVLINKMRFSSANEADRAFEKNSKALIESGYVPTSMEELISGHQVPYDAIERSSRFKNIYPDLSTGLSGSTHRVRALGHDPLLGLIFGTANIVTNTVTVNNFVGGLPSYHVDPLTHQICAKTDIGHIMKWNIEMLQTHPEVVGGAFVRQIVHIGTDAFTPQGVPLPVINNIDPEFSRFLIGNQIDFFKVSSGMLFSVLINKFVEMFHRLFFRKGKDDERLYEVRTKKIIIYSNTMSSLINAAVVGVTGNIKMLDIGGLMVTLWRIFTDRERIHEIKMQFINETLDGIRKKEEDEVNNRLAPYGYSIDNLLNIK